jgi:alkyl sulfatase BDS1-like metallo-beta-lactamase superfamily hydrolase
MPEQKDATTFTQATNNRLLSELNWDDTQDFELASRGYIASLDDPSTTDADGRPVWDVNAFPLLGEETAPPTVNPGLWRQSRLNTPYHATSKS